MVKTAHGVPTRHIMASHGADTDIMKFYTTENASNYGQRWANFKPRTTRHTGTGYQANFRPGVYYSQKLDHFDNPAMGNIIRDNYHSVTEKSYRPYDAPDGNELLPHNVHQVGSGFIRQKGVTIPTEKAVRDVCVNTRIASAPVDMIPRVKPYLKTIQPKDPIEEENCNYGPGYMTTECSERFMGYQPARADVSRKSVGGNEGSGFTHSHNEEPVTYHPDYAHRGNMPAWQTSRPTGYSILKTDFRPFEIPRGNEPLPVITGRAARETGFTVGTKAQPSFLNRVMSDAYDKMDEMAPARIAELKKADPAGYLNITQPNNHSSVTTNLYRGQQRPSKTESDRLARTGVGNKELTGFVENNDRFVATADNPKRFVTHCMAKFQDSTPVGMNREGHTWGAVQDQKMDIFSKSTHVHGYGPEINSTATIRRLNPYVGRSIVAQDPFADDHTYDAKLHSSVISAY